MNIIILAQENLSIENRQHKKTLVLKALCLERVGGASKSMQLKFSTTIPRTLREGVSNVLKFYLDSTSTVECGEIIFSTESIQPLLTSILNGKRAYPVFPSSLSKKVYSKNYG